MSYRSLSEELHNPRSEALVFVKYFSAIADFRAEYGSPERHLIFNRAQEAHNVEVILGKFKGKAMRCRNCGESWTGHEEKETDVNIALSLLDDCYQGLIDVAYIVTTDSDIAPAARLIRQRFPAIELVAVSTPGRHHSKELLEVCGRKAKVTEQMVRQSRLPSTMQGADGQPIECPSEYR